ncbi:MAG: 50S ribosomal protein L21 [Gammaproteobacteria bacterium]|jgi:large subunit ribosomal protein L21|nr:50S ribosomal protein L21 [Gammaproteobacteria bacterium]
MYAVFQTGGKQYRASKGDVIRVEKIDAEEGAIVNIDRVLMITNGEDVKVGAPLIEGGSVSAKVRSQGRAAKIRIIKHRRRKHYHKEQGHRQYYTELQITDISTGA